MIFQNICVLCTYEKSVCDLKKRSLRILDFRLKYLFMSTQVFSPFISIGFFYRSFMKQRVLTKNYYVFGFNAKFSINIMYQKYFFYGNSCV